MGRVRIELFALILRRGHAIMLFEHCREVSLVIESHSVCYLRHIYLILHNQAGGLFQTKVTDEVPCRYTRYLFHLAMQLRTADTYLLDSERVFTCGPGFEIIRIHHEKIRLLLTQHDRIIQFLSVRGRIDIDVLIFDIRKVIGEYLLKVFIVSVDHKGIRRFVRNGTRDRRGHGRFRSIGRPLYL